MLRVLAEFGAQAELLSLFLAAVVGILVLVCVVAALVAIFTNDADRRQICYRIFRTLLRFLFRRWDK